MDFRLTDEQMQVEEMVSGHVWEEFTQKAIWITEESPFSTREKCSSPMVIARNIHFT